MASQHGDSQAKATISPNAAAQQADASVKLTVGSVYRGTIQSRDEDGTYTVAAGKPTQTVCGVLLATPVFGGLMGFNIKCRLAKGTDVEFSFGNPSFIHAVLPKNTEDWKNARNRSLLWGEPADKDADGKDNFSEISDDMVPGELEISNLFGVALSLLTTLSRMSAGDRAAVECHLINDMVRVISAQYRHISGIGDDLIFDHGRPTMERRWSSYRHELMNALKEKEELAKLNGDEVDRAEAERERITAVGRHRLVEFMGFAGDFIHSFVADPAATAVQLAQNTTSAGAGKSWIHRNSDGSVIVQSVADIRIERVCAIPLPFRVASHEHPEVTAGARYENLEQEFLKLPKFGSLARNNAFLMAYHIRQYSRWLSRYHAFARMLQLDSEYKVPRESAVLPEWTNREEDRETANGRAGYFEAYACITIMRDGSIVLHDGYGASVVMSHGNLQLSAARHLDLEAAGDIRMVSGGSIFMRARRNIELTATFGGLVFYSYAWLRMLCAKGSVWIRSAAKPGQLEPAAEGMPVPEIAGGKAAETTAAGGGYPVLIESTDGPMMLRSDSGMIIQADGAKDAPEDDLVILSRGNLIVRGQRSAQISTPRTLSLSGSQSVAIAASAIISNASQMFIGRGGGALIYKGGKLFATRIEAFSMSANAMTNMSGKVGKRKEDDPVEAPAMDNTNANENLATAIDLISQGPDVPWSSRAEGPEWYFCQASEYLRDGRDGAPGGRPETLTQQYLRQDLSGSTDYEVWNLKLSLTGRRTQSVGCFGNQETLFRASDEGDNLHAASTKDPADFSTIDIQWSGNEFTMRALK